MRVGTRCCLSHRKSTTEHRGSPLGPGRFCRGGGREEPPGKRRQRKRGAKKRNAWTDRGEQTDEQVEREICGTGCIFQGNEGIASGTGAMGGKSGVSEVSERGRKGHGNSFAGKKQRSPVGFTGSAEERGVRRESGWVEMHTGNRAQRPEM